MFLALYTTTKIIDAMDECAAVKLEFEMTMPWFALLTLEFSRFCTCASNVTPSEKKHFNEMQTNIVCYLEKEKNLTLHCQVISTVSFQFFFNAEITVK